jgi:hypothetical protein
MTVTARFKLMANNIYIVYNVMEDLLNQPGKDQRYISLLTRLAYIVEPKHLL